MKRKKYINWVAAIRKEVTDQDYIKRRYFHFKIMAFHCAIEFYRSGVSHNEQSAAYKLYIQYMNKANWYYRRLDRSNTFGHFWNQNI